LIAQGVEPRQIAVLYRVNAQSASLEEAFTEAQIPYSVRGGERFFDRREVRDAIALLRGAARADAGADDDGSLADQVAAVLGSVGYRASAPAGPSQARDRWESWTALIDLAAELGRTSPAATLDSFVNELQLRSSAAHAPVADAVTLSTMHAAKGLEWDAVFLIGLTEGMVPITYATTPDQVAEERRLLYVGITRARRHLTLSYARLRRPSDRRPREPSRFLASIAPELGRAAASQTPAPRRSRSATCRGCGRALTTGAERKLGHCSQCEVEVDLGLFEKLRDWRKQTAEAASVPAFVVFTDATLTAVAVEHPQDAAALLKIPGIGQVKVDRYGAELLTVVRSHRDAPQ
jgi:DNA helicase-2/ATP-dependent DNA helicase PcrA